jgi:hypothetical protein
MADFSPNVSKLQNRIPRIHSVKHVINKPKRTPTGLLHSAISWIVLIEAKTGLTPKVDDLFRIQK